VIAGYYGFGNAGDELILFALVRRFRQKNPNLSITVLSQEPDETARCFGVRALNRWRPWTWVPSFVNASHFILGGGGLLQESTGPWNHFYYLSLLLAAKLFRCRTEVIALGVDPMANPLNRVWTRWVLNVAADDVSVRDDPSRKALVNVGVTIPISLRPDPVFDLNVEPPLFAPSGIALALSESRCYPDWSSKIISLCERLNKELHVPLDLLVFFPEEDESLARDIAAHCPAIRQVRISTNPIDLLAWMPQYQLVAATRFHALVLAARSNVSFIGWGSQNKVSSLCKEREMPYINTEEKWDENDEFRLLTSMYQSRNKSVILETRTA